MLAVVSGSVVVVAGEAEERLLEAAGGDLEVVRGGLGEQVARDRVGVLGVDVDGVAADVDALDPGSVGEPVARRRPARVARTVRPAASALIWLPVPSATIRPWLISTIRSAYWSASSR